jgi:hypothetical protein
MLGNNNLVAPYLEWAVTTRFAYLNGQWFRVLLELNRSASSFWSAAEEMEAHDFIVVPGIYKTAPDSLRAQDITFCMAIMSRKALETLVTGEEPSDGDPRILARLTTLAKQIRTIELGTSIEMPQVKDSPSGKFETSSARSDQESTDRDPRPRVVVGVIDDGLAFAHERFRLSNGNTRFKYFLNLDDGTPSAPGPGLELVEGDINNLLGRCKSFGIVDEDHLYRLAGQNLVARRAKHGTHIMDIACGLDPDQVDGDSPYLIGVQLPKWVTEETSGAKLTGPALYAINYIIDRADQIASHEGTALLPVVINLSYGNIAGPHDGTGPLESAIDQLIAARAAPLRVVLPAGNHYLARCHSSFDLTAKSSSSGPARKLRWRVQPDNKAASFMEIWLPSLAADHKRPRVAVRLTAPTGERSPWVQPGATWPPLGTNNVRFSVSSANLTMQRPWILLSLAPTETLTPGTPTAPSGTWLVEIKNQGGAVSADAWVQRGDTPFGYPLWGRQSRFDDNDYQRFDIAGRPQEEDSGPDPSIGPSSIRRRGSINALATEQRAVVIGGFRRSDRRPSRYSGAGPVATPLSVPPQRTGPDAAAVADDSVALHGLLGAGTRTGSVVAMNGTSVAAPQITRLIARWMSLGLASDRTAVQDFAAANDTFPAPAAPAPNERIGAGRIELPPRIVERWKRWP